jgi:hypothetical protein
MVWAAIATSAGLEIDDGEDGARAASGREWRGAGRDCTLLYCLDDLYRTVLYLLSIGG